MLMVKCWWQNADDFPSAAPLNLLEATVGFMQLPFHVQLQSATDVYTAFHFHCYLGKHFQTSGVSKWWTIPFSCRRPHTMPMQSRRKIGSIHRLTAGRSINRHWTRKQLENSQDTLWHEGHTCCIGSLTQVVNFGSKMACFICICEACDKGLDLRFNEYNYILETRSNLQKLINEISAPYLYAE